MDPRPSQSAYKVIVVLLTTIVLLLMVLAWRWNGPIESGGGDSSYVFQIAPVEVNLLRKKYPQIDFTRFYPGLVDVEIDAIQRETYAVRLGYAPLVQFAPLAMDAEHVKVSPAGYRLGAKPQPWPPRDEDFVVFVYGGSTVFGYGLPDRQTLVAALQETLVKEFPERSIQCYNFGRGFYYSTQERLLFESHLLAGIVPNAVIFVDGLNDFFHYDGRPQITERLHNYLAADVPYPPKPPVTNPEQQVSVASAVLNRYANNVHMISALGEKFGIQMLFVGQPVPHFQYEKTEQLYPFFGTDPADPVVQLGYPEFKRRGEAGHYGEHFVWLGDAFGATNQPAYLDQAHYTAAASLQLARGLTALVKKRNWTNRDRSPEAR